MKSSITSLAVGAAALVAGIGIGFAGVAMAETPTPAANPQAPQAQPQQQQGWGRGYGRMGGPQGQQMAGQGRMMGARQASADLAETLGVSQEKLDAAWAKFRTENPMTTRGRDMTDAQRDARHEALATFLASELKLDQAKVEAALDARAANCPRR